MVFLGGAAQSIKDHAGLNPRDALRGIDFEDAGHVFRKIENDGGVTTLSGKRGAAAAG
jgi:hypothetical protein